MIGALDIGGTKTIVGLVDHTGIIIDSHQLATNTIDCSAHLQSCVDKLHELACKHNLSLPQLDGIGATVPGVVDTEHQYVVMSAYTDWNNRPITQMLATACQNDRVLIENDVNACALAELRFGYRDRFHSFIWVTVSTGIGGAVVCGGKLVRGALGSAGEIGHVKVEFTEPLLCPSCGKHGCLEAHGSGKSLDRLFAAAVQQRPAMATQLQQRGMLPDGKSCTALAAEGDAVAIDCLRHIGDYLGRGIASAVNLLNPQAVIFGGGVSMALPLLHPYISKSLSDYAHPSLLPVELCVTKLGYNAAFVGAAALVAGAFPHI